MVKFCPNCEKVLRKKKKDDGSFVLLCRACEYEEDYSKDVKKKSMNKVLEKKILDNKTRVISGDSAEVEFKPKTKVVCPKCGHDEAFYDQFQTRSADEPATTFYSCVKCKNRWREY